MKKLAQNIFLILLSITIPLTVVFIAVSYGQYKDTVRDFCQDRCYEQTINDFYDCVNKCYKWEKKL